LKCVPLRNVPALLSLVRGDARSWPLEYRTFCFTRRAELLAPGICATFERQFGIDPSQVPVL